MISKSVNGAGARRKGLDFERDVAKLLHSWTGLQVDRILGQERDGGYDLRLDPFAIQCKRVKDRKGLSVKAWWLEIYGQAWKDGLFPCLCYKVDRGPVQFMLPLTAVAGIPNDGNLPQIHHTIVIECETFKHVLLTKLSTPIGMYPNEL